MREFSWTAGEKKIAHRVFDKAVEAELAELVALFKARAAAVQTVEEVWDIRDWLGKRQREIDAADEFRYSRLIAVFATLVRSRRIDLGELAGLAEAKIVAIRQISEI